MVIVAWCRGRGVKRASRFQLEWPISCSLSSQATDRLLTLTSVPQRSMLGYGARYLQDYYSPWVTQNGGYVRENDLEWPLRRPCVLVLKRCPLTGGGFPQRWRGGRGVTWTEAFCRCPDAVIPHEIKLKDTGLISCHCLPPQCIQTFAYKCTSTLLTLFVSVIL